MGLKSVFSRFKRSNDSLNEKPIEKKEEKNGTQIDNPKEESEKQRKSFQFFRKSAKPYSKDPSLAEVETNVYKPSVKLFQQVGMNRSLALSSDSDDDEPLNVNQRLKQEEIIPVAGTSRTSVSTARPELRIETMSKLASPLKQTSPRRADFKEKTSPYSVHEKGGNASPRSKPSSPTKQASPRHVDFNENASEAKSSPKLKLDLKSPTKTSTPHFDKSLESPISSPKRLAEELSPRKTASPLVAHPIANIQTTQSPSSVVFRISSDVSSASSAFAKPFPESRNTVNIRNSKFLNQVEMSKKIAEQFGDLNVDSEDDGSSESDVSREGMFDDALEEIPRDSPVNQNKLASEAINLSEDSEDEPIGYQIAKAHHENAPTPAVYTRRTTDSKGTIVPIKKKKGLAKKTLVQSRVDALQGKADESDEESSEDEHLKGKKSTSHNNVILRRKSNINVQDQAAPAITERPTTANGRPKSSLGNPAINPVAARPSLYVDPSQYGLSPQAMQTMQSHPMYNMFLNYQDAPQMTYPFPDPTMNQRPFTNNGQRPPTGTYRQSIRPMTSGFAMPMPMPMMMPPMMPYGMYPPPVSTATSDRRRTLIEKIDEIKEKNEGEIRQANEAMQMDYFQNFYNNPYMMMQMAQMQFMQNQLMSQQGYYQSPEARPSTGAPLTARGTRPLVTIQGLKKQKSEENLRQYKPKATAESYAGAVPQESYLRQKNITLVSAVAGKPIKPLEEVFKEPSTAGISRPSSRRSVKSAK